MYGTTLPHISEPGDRYGFVNEYEVRAAAGVMLGAAVWSFVSILFFAAYAVPLVLMSLMWVDFVLRVFVGPGASLSMRVVQPFVKRTYWVGAFQKRFAWGMGLVLSSITLVCVLITSGLLNHFGIWSEVYAMSRALPVLPGLAVAITPPIIICVLCIVFMALEAFAGYCVGCHIYAFLVRRGWMSKRKNQTCANGVCEI